MKHILRIVAILLMLCSLLLTAMPAAFAASSTDFTTLS